MATILFITRTVSRFDVTAEVYAECKALLTSFADERLGVCFLMLTPVY